MINPLDDTTGIWPWSLEITTGNDAVDAFEPSEAGSCDAVVAKALWSLAIVIGAELAIVVWPFEFGGM
jgi:hypothetical protein